MEAEAASFNTCISLTSLGLMSLSVPLNVMPSTMMSGSFPAEIERVPRMRMLPSSPGLSESMNWTPATEPRSACPILLLAVCAFSPRSAFEMEPVTNLLDSFPYPTKITSSRRLRSSCMVRWSSVFSVHTTSKSLKPRNITLRVSPLLHEMENLPSMSEVTPVLSFVTMIEAPASGSSLLSVTVPE